MPQRDRPIRIVQVLLSVVALEFFGPAVRDFGPSHAFHPDWVGHARVHLVWLLGFMVFSGVANLWLVWFRKPFELRNLWLSVVWQACNLGGFWVAYFLVDVYDGEITVPDVHMHVFGYDENVFGFTILTILLVATVGLLARIPADGDGGANG